MVRARCPFCGEENEIGLSAEELGVRPTKMVSRCHHFLYFSPTKYPGIYYARQILRAGELSGGPSLEAELLRILGEHFKFVGPVAFAPSEEAEARAREAVEDFLRARNITARSG
jgi:hypothetical protein